MLAFVAGRKVHVTFLVMILKLPTIRFLVVLVVDLQMLDSVVMLKVFAFAYRTGQRK